MSYGYGRNDIENLKNRYPYSNIEYNINSTFARKKLYVGKI